MFQHLFSKLRSNSYSHKLALGWKAQHRVFTRTAVFPSRKLDCLKEHMIFLASSDFPLILEKFTVVLEVPSV